MNQKFKNKKWDVIVLGAGIAGLGVARALVLKKKKVLILEKKVQGMASLSATGILDPFVDLDCRSEILTITIPAVKKYPAVIRQIESETGIKTGFKKYDLIYVAFSFADEKKLRAFSCFANVQKKLRVKWLSPVEIQKKVAGVHTSLHGGLCLQGMARVIPGQLLKALRAWLVSRGVQFQELSQKPELEIIAGQARGIRAGSRSFKAENVVGCLGAWAAAEKKASKLSQPIEPIRGQVLIYSYKKKLSALLHTVDGGYLIPWKSGQVLVGSTVENKGFHTQLTAAGRKKIHEYAVQLLPELQNAQPRSGWAGLRPKSLNQRLRIGKTDIKGYYVANGYYRSGILIGIYAGELLAQEILTGKCSKLLKPFSCL